MGITWGDQTWCWLVWQFEGFARQLVHEVWVGNSSTKMIWRYDVGCFETFFFLRLVQTSSFARVPGWSDSVPPALIHFKICKWFSHPVNHQWFHRPTAAICGILWSIDSRWIWFPTTDEVCMAGVQKTPKWWVFSKESSGDEPVHIPTFISNLHLWILVTRWVYFQ